AVTADATKTGTTRDTRGRSVRRASPTGAGTVSTVAVNVALVVAAVYFLLPLVWVLIAATKSPADLFGTFGLWFSDTPRAWENLVALFTQDGGSFTRWVLNSVLYSGVGAFVAMVISA